MVGRFGSNGARTLAAAIGLAGVMLVAACAPPPPTVFPDVPGVGAADAINDRGDIVGTWASGTITRDPDRHGFVRLADGTVVDLIDPAGYWTAAEGVDVNNEGVVVGNLLRPRRTGTTPGIPFVWTRTGGVVALPAIEGETALRAHAVTDDGRVLVSKADGNRAFIYDLAAGTYAELPGVGSQWYVVDMNNQGDVVGTSWATAGASAASAVVWRGPAHVPTVLTGTGGAEVRVQAINDRGVIVANRADVVGDVPNVVAWLSVDGAPVDLGPGYAEGLNDGGCVVGAHPDGARAWHITGGPESITVLSLSEANAVNEHGTIAGSFDDPATSTFDTHPAIGGGCPGGR